MAQSPLKVGLAVGYGTGDELAVVFEKMLPFLAEKYNTSVEIIRSPRTYHTYFSMDPENTDPRYVQQETDKDVEAYEEFCKELVAQDAHVMFKTAINAQSLYLIRQHQEAVKVECFTQNTGSLLLVRDQAQGFYTGSNEHDVVRNSVAKRSEFYKDLTGRIVKWSIDRGREQWGEKGIDAVVMTYKFHLFDGIMSAWAKEWTEQYGIKIGFVQPDTANRNLLAYGLQGNQIMIAGNEWADIMHVMLLNMFGHGAQETRCTENVYLRDDLNNLVEYQTVHGSADDIGGKGVVNPAATIRACARILDAHGGAKGLEDRMDSVLHNMARIKACTRDQGGKLNTKEVVDRVVEAFSTTETDASMAKALNGTSIPASTHFSQNKRTAVIVMDFQNDFVTSEGIGAHYRGDMGRMAGPAQNIPQVIQYARQHGHEVIYVRFLGDKTFQLDNWRARDAAIGKEPKCLDGTWGAALFDGFEPAPGEKVFDKKAHFDAFLCDGFEDYLVAKGIEHLVMLGVYTDVCVDSTARSAFQKGYYISLASDCTTTLHLDFEPYLAYMKRLYGARIMTHDQLMADAPPVLKAKTGILEKGWERHPVMVLERESVAAA